MSRANIPICAMFIIVMITVAKGQYYAPPNMGGAVGCVVTENKLYSHGNFIRELNAEELKELDKYKKTMLEFKEKVDAVYANLNAMLHRNGSLPAMPTRPQMPAFCASNETTLYILGGCTVQNYKVYIGGKFARELNLKEREQLDQFAKQMIAANYAAAQAASVAAQNVPTMADSTAVSSAQIAPTSTTISPITDTGRQIALDFCTEF